MPKDNKVKKEKKHFFRDFKAELKRVIWPTPKQLINNTIAVITIVLITAAVVFALDFVFENISLFFSRLTFQLNKYGINKIKETVESHKQEENTEGENANKENAENSENNGETENGTEDNTAKAENKEVE